MPSRETGFRFLFEVEKTLDKGLGVFAGEAIKKGSVVWRHTPGAFLVYDEASFGSAIDQMTPSEVVYELTHVHAFEEFPGCLIRVVDGGELINHSSDPNLATNKTAPDRPRFDVGSPGYLQKVAAALFDDRYSLVAIRNIEEGEELLANYNADDNSPSYYDTLYEQFGVREDYLDDR